MVNYSQAEYNALLARQLASDRATGPADHSPERDLHNKILAECKRRGWIALHSRMDAATGRTIGEPDFILLLPSGNMLLIEVKAGKGKLSPEQLALHAWASKLGHNVYTINSFQGFLNLL